MRMGRLDLGYTGELLVRTEEVQLGVNAPLRLLFLSDLHFWGAVGQRTRPRILQAACDAKPDHIILGGDLADSQQGLRDLTRLLVPLTRMAPVSVVPGNHDLHLGLRDVRSAIEAGGAHWLGNKQRPLYKGGHLQAVLDGHIRPRATDGVPRVLAAHDPSIFPQACERGYQLVLAGHLHGGQLVAWQHQQNLYPGRFFFRWNGLRFEEGPSTLIVSRGAGDLLPIRYDCPREAVLCDLAPNAIQLAA